MSRTPKRAMVLAAGLGVRMRPLTDEMPKPLVPVAGKALIDYALDRFAGAGVETAVVNAHHFADMLEAHLADRRAPRIVVSDERARLMETGGGLMQARALLGEGPVFCTNTDAILIDAPGSEACARLADAWDPARMDALLLLAPIEAASGYDGAGDFDLGADGGLAWRSGPRAPYVYTGLQIISLNLLDSAPEGPFSMRALWEKAAAAGRLRGVVHRGAWMHVGDPAGLAAAERRLAAIGAAAP
ncbi:nucleotidyltransferase family protein [Amphiplicatus metriothermophilus]|uniref:MurNAc alpha-1-phosphate uridylyltransferase n=1 Tax=Amphiplicatus metriothermophilus TaxID=1519374 RepID=A0A239PKT5_9PROT|nr:nucleotidyltransferase family protein [Amphiplicatus metriothermophilus]MBB5517495.1 MurNAc alpha-1-phosphate uridylyltransferase [Amphiplicatus metriothermophilus]SNT68170.1 MurNAc alpha-1-phosphate uridylyltransferase [Amphiplicatus metriothermophilus]